MPGWFAPTRHGRIVRYVADMTGFRDLLAYLMEDCCNGSPELPPSRHQRSDSVIAERDTRGWRKCR